MPGKGLLCLAFVSSGVRVAPEPPSVSVASEQAGPGRANIPRRRRRSMFAARQSTSVQPWSTRVDGGLKHQTATGTRRHTHRQGTQKRKARLNNLGGHEPARLRVVGQVLDAPERLREVVEALS